MSTIETFGGHIQIHHHSKKDKTNRMKPLTKEIRDIRLKQIEAKLKAMEENKNGINVK